METQPLYYLGPEGTFTHQAAIEAARKLAAQGVRREFTFVPCDTVPAILEAAHAGDGWGVIAWENNVEGYVVPNLDLLIDAHDLAGFCRVGVDIAFDAFMTPATYDAVAARYQDLRGACLSCADDDLDTLAIDSCSTVCAHSHGLAQCRRFARDHGLRALPASSNAAACRDLADGQIALGPSICGSLYGLKRVACGVQDYRSAKTDFLVVAPRDTVFDLLEGPRSLEDVGFESIMAFIPLATGPGVLADLLDVLRDAGLNMTSFISRPIKGHDGTYSFIATLDCAPWEPRFVTTFTEIAEHGDWVKTLAVYPRRERPAPPVNEWMLPAGGVRFEAGAPIADWQHDRQIRRELLW